MELGTEKGGTKWDSQGILPSGETRRDSPSGYSPLRGFFDNLQPWAKYDYADASDEQGLQIQGFLFQLLRNNTQGDKQKGEGYAPVLCVGKYQGWEGGNDLNHYMVGKF